ncbi:MAG: hypothetical protein ACI80V_003193 [Rhodothermales bacterium]|jgi:hypothetical protein
MWSHDGAYIYFGEYKDGEFLIQQVRSDGAGRVQTILSGGVGQAISPDGQLLAFNSREDWGDQDRGVRIYDISNGNTIVLDSSSVETFSKPFSGDSQYIVYERNFSGQSQLVVRSVDGEHDLVIGPGQDPLWDITNDYIYFGSEDGRSLNRIRTTTEPTFRPLSAPEEVVRTPYDALYTVDFENEIAYGLSSWNIDLNGPDAILNLVFNYETYLDELFEGTN